ncbi:MAG: LpxI family protein [Salinarimonadaceae bacterium]|nr:MAG: LpxI family protein [Salinarimonadaceae bacterium]
MAAPAEGPVVVLAGGGGLPTILIEALDRSGRQRRVIAFRGFADRGVRMRADAAIDLLDVAGGLALLERWKPAAVVLAGAVTRPSPAAFLGALSALRNRSELSRLMARGDDHLLRAVVETIEERGYRVVGAHEIAPDLIAPPGTLGAVAPDDEARAAIAVGFACLADLSPFDIGQALVVQGERVVAIEGAEGTDRMLARVGSLRGGFIFSRRRETGAILVKSAKQGQERRVDLPTIGPRTMRKAAAAGLAGVAVGAGQTIIVEREATISEADRLGIFLVGIEPAARRDS